MAAEARITPTWKKQKLFISIFLLGFAAVFLWDGAIGYPAADKRYAAWKKHYDAGTLDQWPAEAGQHGWKVDEWQKWLDDPHQHGLVPALRHGRPDYLQQYYCASFLGVLGVIALVYWLRQKGRTVRTDTEAVYSPGGVRIPFSAITGLGKKRWESKGFATVRYEIDGKKGEFLLDDYKFDRDATHQIVKEIEEKLVARSS